MKDFALISLAVLTFAASGAHAEALLDSKEITAVETQTAQIEQALQSVRIDINQLLDAQSQWLPKVYSTNVAVTHEAEAQLKSIASALEVLYGFKDVVSDVIGTRGPRATVPSSKQVYGHVSARDLEAQLAQASAELKSKIERLKHQSDDIALGETFVLQPIYDHLQQAKDLSNLVVSASDSALRKH
jgi:small-conductance mechanosensitive channel